MALVMSVVYTAVGSAQTDPPTARFRSGPISKFVGVEEAGGSPVCTSSESYSDLPNMVRAFTISGTKNRSVIVLFQGSNWSHLARQSGAIQLTIDNVPNPGAGASNPILMGFNFDPDNGPVQGPLGSYGFNFQTDPLTPGPHIARIRWKAWRLNQDLNAGILACVGHRSLIVLYK
jgi:hypothetical protein